MVTSDDEAEASKGSDGSGQSDSSSSLERKKDSKGSSSRSSTSSSSSSGSGDKNSKRSSSSRSGSGSGSSDSEGGNGGSSSSSSASSESGDEEEKAESEKVDDVEKEEAESERVGDVEEEEGQNERIIDAKEEEEEDVDDGDLFGSNNEDYQKTTANSTLPIPDYASLPRSEHNRSFHGRGRGSNGGRGHIGGRWDTGRRGEPGHFNDRGPPLLPRPGPYQQRNYYGPAPDNRRPERLVAELKISINEEILSRKGTPFQQPFEIGNYSRAPDGTVHFDNRCLRPFQRRILGESGFDLNKGYETFVEKREDLECHGFGDLLACIRNKAIPLENIHFITSLDNLTKIFESAYNHRQPWEMGVHKRNGTVYLDMHKLQEHPEIDLDHRRAFWDYSYKNYATTEINEETSEDPTIVDANVEYCAAIRTKLGAHRIIMSANIDSYALNRDGQRYNVELESTNEVDDSFIETFEREKLLKYWIRSFIAGIPRVVIGFRGNDGRVSRSFAINTPDIPEKVKRKKYWQATICIAFADEVLCWLYGSVKENENYILQFKPHTQRLELLQADTCPDVIAWHIEQLGGD